MANKRTYWAVEALGVAAEGTGVTISNAQFVPGVQSVGITTNFNLEQIFQLGQLEIYQDLEEVPDVEISVERVLDQFNCMYGRTMDEAAPTAITIAGDQNNKCDIVFSVNNEVTDDVAGDNDPLAAVWCSGMFCSSASFSFGVDGNFTESTTLVGNHKKWSAAPGASIAGLPTDLLVTAGTDPTAGLVSKRQHFWMTQVPAPISALTTGEKAIQSINISVDFGREEINALGTRLPYHRFVTFPVEVSCEIEAIVTDVTDMATDALPNANNTAAQNIAFSVGDVAVGDIVSGGASSAIHSFDLGTKNRMQSVTWNGVDTGGGNASLTYSFRNFNKLDYTYAGAAGLN